MIKHRPIDHLAFYAISVFLLQSTVSGEVETYKIDPAHSSISFKVRHFFTPVPGRFPDFKGTIKLDRENPANNYAEAVIEATSVDTNNERRDKHLRNDDFFNTSVFPAIEYVSTAWEKTGKDQFKVTGKLTILETIRNVVMDVRLLGSGSRRGKFLTGWEATTTLDRTDYGITYGQGIVGNEVQIEITIEAARK